MSASRSLLTGRKSLLAFSEVELPPPFIGPRIKPCTIEDHKWALSIEDGQVNLLCLDACSDERKCTMDTDRHGPMCDVLYEFAEMLNLDEIPVVPRIESENTPSGPWGPAEYDAWLVVTPEDQGA